MSNDSKCIIKAGEFPFPLSRGPEESRYLTWVRNHSNYMAARGFLDYLRAIGVLVRGVLINFLSCMPYMLVVSLWVALSTFLQFPPPFILTKTVFAIFIVWILAFPILTPYFRIARYQTSRATGSDSSVRLRDALERSFGGFLLAIIGVGALESLPSLLHLFHKLIYLTDFGWANIAAIVGSGSALFGVAPQLLSALGSGIIKSIAMLLLGVLGVFVPLVFILFVVDLIVYGPAWDLTVWAAIACALLPVGILLATLLGWWSGTFKKQETLVAILLLACALGLFAALRAADTMALEYLNDTKSLDEAIAELPEYPGELQQLSDYVAEKPGLYLNNAVAYISDAKLQDSVRRLRYANAEVFVDDYDDLTLSLMRVADNVGFLSQIEDWLAGLEDCTQDDAAARLPEVQKMYRRLAVLDGLYMSPSHEKISTYLITLPQSKIALLVMMETDGLATDVQHPATASCDSQSLQSSSSDIGVALRDWSEIFGRVRNELDRDMARDSSIAYADRIASIVNMPGPELQQLIAKLEQHQTQRRQHQSQFSQRIAEPEEAVAFFGSLNSLGYGADFQPELAALVGQMRYKNPEPDRPLLADLRRFHASAKVLVDVGKTQSAGELARVVALLRKEDVDALSCKGSSYLHRALFADAADLCKQDCPGLAGSEQHLCAIRDLMHDWGEELMGLRHELAATASITLLNSSFYSVAAARTVRANVFWPKVIFVAVLAIELWFLFWLTLDINLTSIHGLYRDRLATAFLVGEDTKGDIDIEKDLDLMEMSNHAEHSVAPYHLVNAALNLQSSKNLDTRDRQSDFFIFSKKFIGGRSTGYCRSGQMEQVFPQMDLATAMAISAAAASPNMGRGTNPLLVALMTLLNIRLGFWLPNPGLVKNWLARKNGEQPDESKPAGYLFEQVFAEELTEIENRWAQLPGGIDRTLARNSDGLVVSEPCAEHNLFGIAFSGGGIRSATVNLGITQALHDRGVFDHFDYMSTVSGGGYLGSSISTLMRSKVQTKTTPAGGAQVAVEPGGEPLAPSFGQIFHWRIRPQSLLREMLGKLNEDSRWVNVSDGGHIENLAAIELLRRRCRYIIIGDGEADPRHHFQGLATLIRTARIDLGIQIDIDFDKLKKGEDGLCQRHWASGRIHYPGEINPGYLLYLKSSITGDEDVVIQQYRYENPGFPHESTADQFFSEGQFEAYRSLGEHIGRSVLGYAVTDEASSGLSDIELSDSDASAMAYAEAQSWFETLHAKRNG